MQKLAVALALCWAVAGLTAVAPAVSSPAPLVGVWDADETFGHDLRGPITVTAGRAEVAGFAAGGETEGTGRVYRFADGRGSLHVAAAAAEAPVAFWVQPATLSGTSYATPVVLRALAPGVARGRVEPVPDRVEMALYVERGPDDTVTAFLRDPLYNLGRRFRTMTVTADGSRLRFSGPGPALSGSIDGPNAITLHLSADDSIPPLTFRRRTASEAPADAGYREPLPTGDGWTIAAAQDAGFAVGPLEELARFAAGAAPTSVSSPDVHSVLVARHGKLVVDDYFAHFDEATLHDTRSAGKTYADVLAGAAIEAGIPLAGDTPLLPLFARYGALANPDPRKSRITLGDALSMSTGLDCDDNDEHSVANEDNEQSQTAQPDWYRLVLDSRMVREPGTKTVYCSASINLAGGAIAAATHAWLPAYFAEHVAQPLHMQRYALNLTPTGDWYLGGGAYVRPRDFLKIGQVFLDGGTWHGRRVLPQAWIERSWDAHLSLAAGDNYGYAWHVRAYTVDGKEYRAFEAQGNGGQILDVLPQLDVAVMITQGNYNNFATWGPARDAIVTRVIKAISDR